MNIKLLSLFIPALLLSCKSDKIAEEKEDIIEVYENSKIKVAVVYGSASYFVFEEKEMGYEFELVTGFAKSIGAEVDLIAAYNIEDLKRIIDNNEADIIAYPLKIDDDIKNTDYVFCGTERITHQVLVQPNDKKIIRVSDVTQLKGKEVYVENKSRYLQRAKNLNREIGGGMIIRTFESDSVSTEDLIRKVAKGEIEYTFADNNIANVSATFFRNIDPALQVSCDQSTSWLVLKSRTKLKSFIDEWLSNNRITPEYAPIVKRYYEKSIDPNVTIKYLLPGGASLSIYDHIYKENAEKLGWDWKLLAALSFEESRFDPYAMSKVGARGLLQMMPKTGYRFGLTEQNFVDPQENIKAGTRYLNSLQRIFRSIEDPEERAKFVLASFHAGVGHILDARAIARKYGYDPDIWDNNVASCLILKSETDIYQDSALVKCGYFKGETTLEHVSNITNRYQEFSQRIK